MLQENYKIIEIGKKGECNEQELHYFLPNFPTVRGSEYVFLMKPWNNIQRWDINDIIHFVKGLHYIELKYCEMKQYNFGFGSPSRTNSILQKLERFKKNQLASELREWIRSNGGNYYIKLPKIEEKPDYGSLFRDI